MNVSFVRGANSFSINIKTGSVPNIPPWESSIVKEIILVLIPSPIVHPEQHYTL